MNGISSKCENGVCWAKDENNDLCYLLNYPCGKDSENDSTDEEEEFSCRRPCNLSYYIQRFVNVAPSASNIIEFKRECRMSEEYISYNIRTYNLKPL